jgi:hypothetical protein
MSTCIQSTASTNHLRQRLVTTLSALPSSRFFLAVLDIPMPLFAAGTATAAAIFDQAQLWAAALAAHYGSKLYETPIVALLSLTARPSTPLHLSDLCMLVLSRGLLLQVRIGQVVLRSSQDLVASEEEV